MHARRFGVAQLPLGACVEIELNRRGQTSVAIWARRFASQNRLSINASI